MRVRYATQPAPGRANEDHVVIGSAFAIVLDGVTQLPGLDTGCVHSPVWIVLTLGDALAARLERQPSGDLVAVVREAIGDLRGSHGRDCDLDNPDSPSSTVAILRERDADVDYLVLCDSTIVIDRDDLPTPITDDRTGHLPAYDRASVARLRNSPAGFWVASTRPEAADNALAGSVPRAGLKRALLCTDGVSRLVDNFGYSWTEVLDLSDQHGPRSAINAVREAERRWTGGGGGGGGGGGDGGGGRGRGRGRRKIHDDASVAICTFD